MTIAKIAGLPKLKGKTLPLMNADKRGLKLKGGSTLSPGGSYQGPGFSRAV